MSGREDSDKESLGSPKGSQKGFIHPLLMSVKKDSPSSPNDTVNSLLVEQGTNELHGAHNGSFLTPEKSPLGANPSNTNEVSPSQIEPPTKKEENKHSPEIIDSPLSSDIDAEGAYDIKNEDITNIEKEEEGKTVKAEGNILRENDDTRESHGYANNKKPKLDVNLENHDFPNRVVKYDKSPRGYSTSPATNDHSTLSDLTNNSESPKQKDDGLSSSLESRSPSPLPPSIPTQKDNNDGLSITSDSDSNNNRPTAAKTVISQQPLKLNFNVSQEHNNGKQRSKSASKAVNLPPRSSARIRDKRHSLSPEKIKTISDPKRKKSEITHNENRSAIIDETQEITNPVQKTNFNLKGSTDGLNFSSTCMCCQHNRDFLISSINKPMVNSIFPPIQQKNVYPDKRPSTVPVPKPKVNPPAAKTPQLVRVTPPKIESRRNSRAKAIYTANWSAEEDEAYKEAFLRNGNNWKLTVLEHGEKGTIDNRLRDRSSISLGQKFYAIKQCLRRGETHPNHGSLVKVWNDAELKALIDGMAKHGQNWKAVIAEDRRKKGPLAKKDVFDICIKAYSEYDRRSKLKEFLGVFEGLYHTEP